MCNMCICNSTEKACTVLVGMVRLPFTNYNSSYNFSDVVAAVAYSI